MPAIGVAHRPDFAGAGQNVNLALGELDHVAFCRRDQMAWRDVMKAYDPHRRTAGQERVEERMMYSEMEDRGISVLIPGVQQKLARLATPDVVDLWILARAAKVARRESSLSRHGADRIERCNRNRIMTDDDRRHDGNAERSARHGGTGWSSFLALAVFIRAIAASAMLADEKRLS